MTDTTYPRLILSGLLASIALGFPLAITIVCGIHADKLTDTGDTDGANFNIGLTVIFGLLSLRALYDLLVSCYLYYPSRTVEEPPHISLGTPLKDIIIVIHPQDRKRVVGTTQEMTMEMIL
jgi:hypothetical protein